MKVINASASLKQIIIFFLIIELVFLVLSPFKALVLIIPFVPICIYAFNLKINKKEVTLKQLRQYIVVATIVLIASMFILLLLEHNMIVRWRRIIGLISAIFFTAVLVKFSVFSDSTDLDNSYSGKLLLLKQINVLYLLFFGLLSILIYNDFIGVESTASMLLNPRLLIVGVLLVSMGIKVVFLSNINNYHYKNLSSNRPTLKQLEEYKSLLINAFEYNKLYLKHDLNREVIAEETKIPFEHLEYLLNTYLKIDMQNYIAEQRIRYALNLMCEKGDQYTLMAISDESGFRSRVTFNKYFKEFTHMLPSEYLNQTKTLSS